MSKISPTSLTLDLQQELSSELLLIQRQIKARSASEDIQLATGLIDLVKRAASRIIVRCFSFCLLALQRKRLLAFAVGTRAVLVKRCLSL
jgi:hypothetical protein